MRDLGSIFLNALCYKQSSEDLIAFEWELGSNVTIFDEKSRPRGEGTFFLRLPWGAWNRSQSPIRRSQLPLKFHDQNRQNTKEKPTEERKCFPTKAISSNLYFSNKFVSSFRCHYSKMTCCLLTIIDPLSFFSDLLVNIYQYGLALSPLFSCFYCNEPPAPANISQALMTVTSFTWVSVLSHVVYEVL